MNSPRFPLTIEPSSIAASLQRIFGADPSGAGFKALVKDIKHIMNTKLRMDFSYDADFKRNYSYQFVKVGEDTTIFICCPMVADQIEGRSEYPLRVYITGTHAKNLQKQISKQELGAVVTEAIENYMRSQGDVVLHQEKATNEALIATLDFLLLSITAVTMTRFRNRCKLRLRSQEGFITAFREFSKTISKEVPNENVTREYLDQFKKRIRMRIRFIEQEIELERQSNSKNSSKKVWISILLFILLKLKWVLKGL